MKAKIYMLLGDAYLVLGIFLTEEKTSARGLKSVSDSSPLSAAEAIKEASVWYTEADRIKEVGIAYSKLAEYHEARYEEAEHKGSSCEAEQHALLAYESWKRSMDFIGPENEPPTFLLLLMLTSKSSLKLPQSGLMLTEDLSRLLEARRISEEFLAEGFPDGFWARLQQILKTMVLSKKGTDDLHVCKSNQVRKPERARKPARVE